MLHVNMPATEPAQACERLMSGRHTPVSALCGCAQWLQFGCRAHSRPQLYMSPPAWACMCMLNGQLDPWHGWFFWTQLTMRNLQQTAQDLMDCTPLGTFLNCAAPCPAGRPSWAHTTLTSSTTA